ncbi:MAG: ATPase domain-containing protein [Candidatus Micrarchaeota archaeon]
MKKSSRVPASARRAEPKPETGSWKLEAGGRTPTGISGLDDLLEGGFPEGSFVLLSGTCGTGKSIFGMQFVCRGAERGEPGVFLSMEEEPERIIKDMSGFDWDIRKQVDEGRLAIAKPEIYESDAIKRMIVDSVERTGARRLVIDSFTLLSSYLENPFDIRKMIFDISREIKKLNCTTLSISDMPEGGASYSINGFEEFVSDGVVVLSLAQAGTTGAYTRALLVRKMRATSHSLKMVPFKIEREGIKLYPEAELF